MILFKEDWKQYSNAIVDYDTDNESFKRLVYLYKEMGIENCEFPLALLQPELVGVDPFDPNLSQETMFKIALECKYNIFFYLREIALIPPVAGSVPIRFKANRGNIALVWSFFNHIDFGLIQPRQTGKSVSTDVLMNGVLNIWAQNTTTYLITKDSALRAANVERLKSIRALLPEYIYFPNRLDADNNEQVTNLHWNNRYKTAVGRNDKVAADKLGRGLTVPILHIDEIAYVNMIGISLSIALSSGGAARDEAAEAGQPYGSIYTTTAGSLNSRDGAFAHEFLTGGATWTERFFDLENQEELARVVEMQSSGLKPLIYGAFNHRQLGRDDAWLYRKLRESNSHGEVADRDYMNIWTTGAEGTPLSPSEKKAVKGSEQEPLYTDITPDGYVLRWYIPHAEIKQRMAEGRFVLGVDPSEALGEGADATGFYVLDAYTHDTICTGRFNETNLTTMSQFIGHFLIKYTNVTFIPERKSSGTTILDTLFIQLPLEGVDPFKRIYNRIVDEPENYVTEYREIQKSLGSRPSYFYDRYKKYFGYNTSGSGRHSRDNLYGEALKSMLRIGASRVYDSTLINELLSLTIRNGRIDHSVGKHDDMVISMLLAHWFCTKARNLEQYGIDPRKVFAEAAPAVENQDPEELYRMERSKQYQHEFQELIDALTEAEDPLLVSKMEFKLRQLSTKADITKTSGVGIDAMIKQAQEERERRVKVNRFGSRMGHNRFQGGNQRNFRYV